MIKKEDKEKKMTIPRNVVIILVILAVILAGIAFVSNVYDWGGSKLSTPSADSEGGKVGVEILPPSIEDKGGVG